LTITKGREESFGENRGVRLRTSQKEKKGGKKREARTPLDTKKKNLKTKTPDKIPLRDATAAVLVRTANPGGRNWGDPIGTLKRFGGPIRMKNKGTRSHFPGG